MTAGRSSHPDVESLDSYADGSRHDLSVDRHVRDCSDCAEAVAALRQVRSDLARLSTLTMPDDVASRIRAALAADAADADRSPRPRLASPLTPSDRSPSDRAAAGRRSDDTTRARPVRPAGGPHPSPRRRRFGPAGWRPRRVGSPREWLVAAGCLVAVVVVGVTVGGRGTDTTAANVSSGAGESVPLAATDERGASGYARDDARTAEGGDAAAAPGQPPATLASPRPTAPPLAPLAATPTTTVSTSNDVLADSDFAGHASEILSQSAATPEVTVDGAIDTYTLAAALGLSTTGWTTLTSQAAAHCYDDLVSRAGGELLAVDQVRYRGDPALFVVLSMPGNISSVVVVVVDADCVQNGGASSLLRTVTVTRF